MLLSITGCSDSYNECTRDCRKITNDRFTYEHTNDRCKSGYTGELFDNCIYYDDNPDMVKERYYYTYHVNRTAQREHCFNLCRAKQIV